MKSTLKPSQIILLVLLNFFFAGGQLVASGFFPYNDLDKIAKANRYKERANEAIRNEDYELAKSSFHYLLDSMGVDEPEVLLNLAHCYYKTAKPEEASKLYQELVNDKRSAIRAAANQQLGVMQAQKGEFDSALSHLKQALKADPNNEEIRYDYVTVKQMADQKKEEENKEKEQDKKDEEKKDDKKDQKQDQQKQDQQDQQQKDQQDQQKKDQQQQEQESQDKPDDQKQQQEQQKDQQQKDEQKQQEQQQKDSEQNKEQGEKKDAKKSEEEKKAEEEKQMQQMQEQRMQEINMSPEKAKMILDALKNQEVQYYQQLKRKAKPKESDKPDW